jgi:signal peptidase
MRTLARVVAMALAATAVLGVALLVVGPRVLPYRVVPVLGGSMSPTIRLGSLAVMRPVDAGDVRVGDIIIFGRSQGPPTFVTHRVVAIDRTRLGPVFLTKGDANGARDGWYVPAVGTGLRYSFSVPVLGYLIGSLNSGSARTAIGIVLLLALVVWILDGVWRPRRVRTAVGSPIVERSGA